MTFQATLLWPGIYYHMAPSYMRYDTIRVEKSMTFLVQYGHFKVLFLRQAIKSYDMVHIVFFSLPGLTPYAAILQVGYGKGEVHELMGGNQSLQQQAL